MEVITGEKSLKGISIEPFRGDLEGLQAMAHVSWRDEYGIDSFPDIYRPAFLRFLFERIPDKRHLLAAYHGEEIVAFLANLPQKVFLRSINYNAVYSCLLVTRKQWLRRGLGQSLIQEALNLNQDKQYDFAVFALETGHRSSFMVNKLKAAGKPVEYVKKIHVIARILDFNLVCASEKLKNWEKAAIKLGRLHIQPRDQESIILREYRSQDLPACRELLNKYQEMIPMAMVWDEADLGWELDYKDVSQTLVYEKKGKIKALINFLYHDHLGNTSVRWAWMNHVAYPDLSFKEQIGFIQAFLTYIRQQGCAGAIEWMRGYYPQAALFRARFFPYFRAVNLVAWKFNPEIHFKNIHKVYEIQV